MIGSVIGDPQICDRDPGSVIGSPRIQEAGPGSLCSPIFEGFQKAIHHMSFFTCGTRYKCRWPHLPASCSATRYSHQTPATNFQTKHQSFNTSGRRSLFRSTMSATDHSSDHKSENRRPPSTLSITDFTNFGATDKPRRSFSDHRSQSLSDHRSQAPR